MSLDLVGVLVCWIQAAVGSEVLPVSLSVPLQVLGRLEALVSSQDHLHLPLELLGPSCPCEEQQSLVVVFEVGVEVEVGVAVEVEVGVAVARSLQHQTLGGVSRWLCRSGRELAAWCLAARCSQAPRWLWPGLHSPRALCHGSWVVA